MVFNLKHQFRIESARFLPRLPEGHPCKQIHGHSFLITLEIESPSLHPELEWLIDFNQVSEAAKPVLKLLDHQLLNEVPGLENPTSENLCLYIFRKLKPQLQQLKKVSIQETLDTECSVSESI